MDDDVSIAAARPSLRPSVLFEVESCSDLQILLICVDGEKGSEWDGVIGGRCSLSRRFCLSSSASKTTNIDCLTNTSASLSSKVTISL